MKLFDDAVKKGIEWRRVTGQNKDSERIYSYKEVKSLLKKLQKAHDAELDEMRREYEKNK